MRDNAPIGGWRDWEVGGNWFSSQMIYFIVFSPFVNFLDTHLLSANFIINVLFLKNKRVVAL